MNTLHSLFSWTLDTSLRASLLAAVVMLIQLALRGHISARWRYALWLPVLFVLLAPVLPESRWSAESMFAAKAIEPLPMPKWTGGYIPPALPQLPDVDGVSEVESPTAPTLDWQGVLVIVWSWGVIASVFGGIGFYMETMRRFRRTALAPDATLMAMIQTLSASVRLRRAPRVLISSSVDSPAVAGLWRPLLLLPADFSTAFTEAEATLVLKHELMHLKRHDLPVNALLCLLQAIHWFNPLLWLAAARARQDRETACDADVLASDVRDCRSDYGHALLKVQTAYRPRGFSLGLVGIFEGSGAVRARISAIASHRRVHPLMGWLVAVLIGGLGIVGGTRGLVAKEIEPAKQIALTVKFIELGASATEWPTEFSELGERTVSAERWAELTSIVANDEHAKTVTYPRVFTSDGMQVNIRSVVNQPIMTDGKAEDLEVGTSLDITPTSDETGIALDVKLQLSQIPKGLKKGALEAAKSLAEAEAMLHKVSHEKKVHLRSNEALLIVLKELGDDRKLVCAVTPTNEVAVSATTTPQPSQAPVRKLVVPLESTLPTGSEEKSEAPSGTRAVMRTLKAGSANDLSDDPDQAALRSAEAQIASGDTTQARKTLDALKAKGTKLSPEEASHLHSRWLQLAEALLTQKQPLEALAVFESVRGTTDDPALLYRMGRCQYELGRYADVITTFETIDAKFADFPKLDNVLYGMIVAHVALKQSDQALKLCERLTETFPNSDNRGAVAETYGMLLYGRGDKEQAAAHYANALTAPNADHEKLRYLRGNVLFELARFAGAEAEFQSLLKDFPKSAYAEEAVYRLALTRFYQNDKTSTKPSLEQYIQTYPKGQYVVDARYRLAFIAFTPEMTPDETRAVIADLQQIAKDAPTDPNIPQAHCLAGDGLCRLAQAEPEKAAEHRIAAKAAYQDAIRTATTDELRRYATARFEELP